MKLKRVLMAGSVLVAAGFLPVMAAAPAQASPTTCEIYLQSTGRYVLGPKIFLACDYAKFGTHMICQARLLAIGVRPSDVVPACMP
ncbi:hypothetical protein ACFT5C_28225 [Streptomyces sp. NPDC057116]|uniref:hypothetical protein n=1 Tax=Streptomyces sp. NPDC057116 TaxID=3346023 RepID=UPI0036419C40